ncbi:DUF418 domain-containing protein [Jeotgalibacillus proteolyticus]|uniref:DUF418 domain-containing protein n=1 Tax=Jeotgalibacillus proteolyticus TaxID=2082395 RepID=A0A2S5GH45_9BACL|nr:DUF418 domain-containing protein [Jeotgalibacillus proteolyticus]PPA72367.1 DUF418 domain-containing protein [Jeotgalibacillus proteolyticus]
MKTIQPLDEPNRIASLDVMRGFALLGILIVNMIAFHSPIYYYDPYTWWGNSINRSAYWFIDVFVQASFYPLFTMMFGYGLALQFQRSVKKGIDFYSFALKRLAVLLGIGIIHAFFIWSGDILISYAAAGLILIWLLKLEGKWLLILGFILFLLPQALISVVFVIASYTDPVSVTYFSAVQDIQSSIQAYGSGSFSEIFTQRMDDWLYANNPSSFILLMIALLPLMMIGAGISKLQLLEKAKEKKKLFLLVILIAFPIALALKTAPYWGGKNIAFTFVQDFLGGPLLAMVYMALIALIMILPAAVKWLRPFAQTGRMSLTNYLLQSIIGTLIFYSYGLGLYGEVTLQDGLLLAAGIFIIQVILSQLWLTKFSRGPLEYVWRRLSYGKIVK